MPERTAQTDLRADDRNVVQLATLFGFSATLLMVLSIVPEPLAILPIAALILMAQATRVMGQRLYRDFMD